MIWAPSTRSGLGVDDQLHEPVVLAHRQGPCPALRKEAADGDVYALLGGLVGVEADAADLGCGEMQAGPRGYCMVALPPVAFSAATRPSKVAVCARRMPPTTSPQA